MQRSIFAVYTATLVLSTGIGLGQNPPAKVARVEFMKVTPGKGPEYAKLEQTWKDVHQDRVNKGQIDSWALFIVVFPGGAKHEYDAITMHIFPSFAKMESLYESDQIAKIRTFPPANDLRQMVRYEIWSLDQIVGNPLAGKFMDVRFHKAKPGGESDYIRAVREHWMPMNADLSKRGVRTGWYFFSLLFPGGSQRNYDWVTFDALPNFGAVATNTFAGVEEKKLAEAVRLSSKARDTVVNEYWRQVDATTPKK